ncbi:GAF domain-containing protein [Balneolaceae bacterium ANBcel3]|nr:GAF domain-containing protein [Balneolaceae bacterium ANBcel3]
MSEKEISYSQLLKKSQRILQEAADREEAMQHICTLLLREIPHFDWVGFYLVDPLAEKQLILGPYAGEPTEHTRIAFGQGICGQAADTKEVFISQDVSAESNYLSCSPDVQSEIVVPILKGEELIGEIDIDSNQRNAITEQDRELLVALCEELAELF